MSALDHAFIKVYTKDGGTVRTVLPRSQPQDQPTAAAQPPAAQPAARQPTLASSGAQGTWYRVEPAAQGGLTGKPHAQFAGQGSTAVVAPAAANLGTTQSLQSENIAVTTEPMAWQLEPVLVMSAPYESLEPQPVPAIQRSTAVLEEPFVAQAGDRVDPRAEGLDELAVATEPHTDDAVSLTAVWEVDAFCWPEICDRLELSPDECLQDAGKQLLAASQQGLKLLAVTSCRRGEGRTTLALCLARAAASCGARVALLDADLRNPQLAGRLRVDATGGWQDTITGQLHVTDIAITSLEDGVTLLPLTNVVNSSKLALNDARVAQLLAEAARAFDLIVVDMEPMELLPSTLRPQQPLGIDAAIVVQDVRSTTQRDVDRCVAWLRGAGVHAVGVAENFEQRADGGEI